MKIGDSRIYNAREIDGGVSSGRGGRRLFISKNVSKASQSSVERFRVGGTGKMSTAILGEVEVALGVRERYCRGRREDDSKVKRS